MSKANVSPHLPQIRAEGGYGLLLAGAVFFAIAMGMVIGEILVGLWR